MPCLLELSCLEPVIRGTRCRIAVPATGDFADCEQDFADCERRLTHTESSGHDDVFMSDIAKRQQQCAIAKRQQSNTAAKRVCRFCTDEHTQRTY